MNPKQEEQLKDLLKDEFKAPKHLNHNIMQQIRLVAEAKHEQIKELPKALWISIYTFFGLCAVAFLAYFLLYVKIPTNITVWVLGLGAGIPLLIDYFLKVKKKTLV